MSICVACSGWGESGLCSACRAQLRPSSRVRESGVDVVSGLVHETTARRLVHLLKYQGVIAAGVLLAAIMAGCVPAATTALVPVPRATARRIRYGIDPAFELAYRVGASTGIEVIPALSGPLWWRSHAGGERDARHRPRFHQIQSVPVGAVMVDDVFTTGTTLASAGQILGLEKAITATRANSRWYE